MIARYPDCLHTTVLMLHGILNKDISFIQEMVRNKILFTYTLATVQLITGEGVGHSYLKMTGVFVENFGKIVGVV